MIKTLLVTLLSLCSILTFGQSNVELQIQLLTPDQIGEVTLDKDPFFDWMKKINNEVETHLKNEKGNNEVLVLISLHKDKDATIDIGARPKLDKTIIQSLSSKISKHKSPRTKITDFSLAIIAKLNDGCQKEIEFTPVITFPEERNLSEYKMLDLIGKKKALQDWVQNEVIPIVTHYETNVDPKFEGVLNVGRMLEQGEYFNTNIEKLTEEKFEYWRATMEMSGGNQLIPFTKICMLIAKGEFDKAKRLLFIISFFSGESTLPSIFHDEMSTKLDLLTEELSNAINEGIALHDKGKYKKAVSHYETLLKTFPHSAWLNYELYFSKSSDMKDKDKIDREWNKSKQIIYSCDPMYHMNVQAKSGKEGYLLFRRQEINMLFKSKNNIKADFIKYADIALDLENYGFAAQLYWLILNYFSKEDYDDRNIIGHYLYCLDKLGVKEIVKYFKGDFQKEYDIIKNERRQIMEESPIYNAFEKND